MYRRTGLSPCVPNSDDLGAGGHHISQIRKLIARCSGLDLAGPAYNEWCTVAALPLIAFDAPPGPRPVVLVCSSHVQNRRNLRAVVAGEHHQRVVRHAETFESLQKLADYIVHLEDEIAVRPRLGFVLESVGCKRRQVDCLHRMIEKKWLVGIGLNMLLEEFLTLLEKDHIDIFVIEIVSDHASSTIVCVWMLGQLISIQEFSRWYGYTVAVDIGIEPVCGRTGDRSVEFIKAAMNRPIGDRSRIIDLLNTFYATILDAITILVEERHADMPLAETSGGIAFVAKHLR